MRSDQITLVFKSEFWEGVGRGEAISVPAVYREPQQWWGEEAGGESPVRAEAESVGGSPSGWCVRVTAGSSCEVYYVL